jgi:hypothetical protein
MSFLTKRDTVIAGGMRWRYLGYVRDTREKVSQAVSSLKTIGCKFSILYQSLLKSGSELIRCPKKVLRSQTQNPLILQA